MPLDILSNKNRTILSELEKDKMRKTLGPFKRKYTQKMQKTSLISSKYIPLLFGFRSVQKSIVKS
jgi:hypothetical protein